MINKDINRLLFFDIETAAQADKISDMPDRILALWTKRLEKKQEGQERVSHPATALQELWLKEAALNAEFSRVVCICVGAFERNGLKLQDIYNKKTKSEMELLNDFAEVLNKAQSKYILCGHNIKEFDIPFLCKRYLINKMKIPAMLNFYGKKPWEIDVVDTADIWKFGAYAPRTSLDTLTAVFDVPSPKGEMDGSKVHEAFYKGEYQKIAAYCRGDVIAQASVVRTLIDSQLSDEQKALNTTEQAVNQ